MSEGDIILWLIGWSAVAAVAGWTLPARLQPIAILLCGAGLLGTIDPVSLLILLAASALCFVLAQRRWRHGVSLGVILVVTMFVAGAWRGAQDSRFSSDVQHLAAFGMSYYALRLIHYLIESHMDRLRPHSFTEFLCYQLFPSTLAAGPIHRFDEFLRDLRRRRWDIRACSEGFERIVRGLARIVIVANALLGQIKPYFAAAIATGDLKGLCIQSAFTWTNLYLQFSGFSEIAIGLGAICGFRIMENFQRPFLARNIGEFWRRWHISLTSWCRDYIYTPVLAIGRNHVVAVLASMIVVGLWHEFSARYIVWGLYHGTGIAVWRWFDGYCGGYVASLGPIIGGAWRATATAATLGFIVLSFPAITAIEQLLLRYV